jgi:hypothetical protein
MKYASTGSGKIGTALARAFARKDTHAEAKDRPPSIFGSKNRLHFEPGKKPYLLLPIIP